MLLSMVFSLVGCGGGGGGGGGSSTSNHTVTYNGNSNTGGNVPTDSNSYQQGNTVTVLGNTGSLVRIGYTFSGWNTKADGSGTSYTAGSTFAMGTANVALYAKWTSKGTVIGYAYAANQYDDTISQYTIGSDGTLTAMTTATVTTGDTPEWITTDPSGKYVYVVVAHPTPGRVYQYTIGSDGVLTPMSIPWIAADTYPDGIAIDPSGKYAYVANNQTNNVSQYTIGLDGSLTPMSPATVMSGMGYPNAPSSVVVDPSGKYVYVGNNDGKSVSQYTIGTTGHLSPMSTATVSTGGVKAWHMAINPSGTSLYVTSYWDDSILQFSIGTTGALTLVPSSTVTTVNPAYTADVVIDPTGTHAYAVTTSAANAIYLYTIGMTGMLTPMSTPTMTATTYFAGATIDSTGKYFYAVSGYPGSTISQYIVNTDGSLTAMSPATVSSGQGPVYMVTVMK